MNISKPDGLMRTAATVLVFAALGAHVLAGGAYEMRTVGAMAVRSVAWGAIALLAYRRI